MRPWWSPLTSASAPLMAWSLRTRATQPLLRASSHPHGVVGASEVHGWSLPLCQGISPWELGLPVCLQTALVRLSHTHQPPRLSRARQGPPRWSKWACRGCLRGSAPWVTQMGLQLRTIPLCQSRREVQSLFSQQGRLQHQRSLLPCRMQPLGAGTWLLRREQPLRTASLPPKRAPGRGSPVQPGQRRPRVYPRGSLGPRECLKRVQ